MFAGSCQHPISLLLILSIAARLLLRFNFVICFAFIFFARLLRRATQYYYRYAAIGNISPHRLNLLLFSTNNVLRSIVSNYCAKDQYWDRGGTVRGDYVFFVDEHTKKQKVVR